MRPRHRIDWSDPFNSDHPLNQNGLVSWWLAGKNPFWGGPLFRDLVPKGANRGGNHGTLTNGPTWTGGGGRPGGYGGLQENGTNQRVDCGSASALNLTGPLTLSCWVKPLDLATQYRGLINKEDWANSKGYYLGLSPGASNLGGVYFGFNRGGNEITTAAATVSLGNWVHLAGVYDGSGLVIYKNGLSIQTGGSSTAPVGHSLNLYLGYYFTTADNYTSAVWDDVRIHSRALSAADIADLYDQSRRGHPDTLRWISQRAWFVPQAGTGTAGSVIPVFVHHYRQQGIA